MGTGQFKNGKFDFTVVANFPMTDGDRAAWERAFRKASELLWNASEGQMSFGQVFICDDNLGAHAAEMILHASGDPSYATLGGFGKLGKAIHLMPYVTTRGPLTIVHEMGHHVWEMYDEYTAPLQKDDLARGTPAPNKFTIPISPLSGRRTDELVGNDALLKFGQTWERRKISANTATKVIVRRAFSDLPTNSTSTAVWYQSPAECSDVHNSNYCIMENSRDAAGYFDSTGSWNTVSHPVTEFCVASNHDPDGDTAHENRHRKSCWETIVNKSEFKNIRIPNVPSDTSPSTPDDLQWIELEKQPRFSLVLDRSGSMGGGRKMPEAQHGAIYWMEYCALSRDFLSIYWYNHLVEEIMPLTEVGTLSTAETQDVKVGIRALTPNGNTNIRDGLAEGLNGLQSRPSRAAVEVALLLTDGIHNTPRSASPREVIPSFLDRGATIFALGVGGTRYTNMSMLNDLAEGTGGQAFSVEHDRPCEIEAAMVEINAMVRGGILSTETSIFRASEGFGVDDRSSRPSLIEILKSLDYPDVEYLYTISKDSNSPIRLFRAYVEEGAERASFSVVYPQPGQVWLYLLDPDGNAYTGSDLQHVISDASHEFAIVNGPQPGLWNMVGVRAKSGSELSVRAISGVENRHIQVFGGATTQNHVRGAVGVWATARCMHELSGLKVTAQFIDPNGQMHDLNLSDHQPQEPQSGLYQAAFFPRVQGQYRGLIHIENTGYATVAGALRHISHTTGQVHLPTTIPRFVRKFPCSFHVGDQVELDDRIGDESP